MSNIVREDRLYSHIPDYSVEFDGEDLVLFRSRGTVNAGEQKELFDNDVRLSGDVYEQARQAAPGWDVYRLEQEWREWTKEPPRNADAAFVGFCRVWFERHGRCC